MGKYNSVSVDGRRVDEHVLVAERAFGGPLPKGVEVHHVDEDGKNNDPLNLVICTAEYHDLLHVRMRSYAASGHHDWRKCAYCDEHDDVANMYNHQPGTPQGMYAHKTCKKKHDHERYLLATNQSSTRVVPLITHHGRTMNQTSWAKQVGISIQLLQWRLRHWPIERALEHPAQ